MSEDSGDVGEIGPTAGDATRMSTSARTFDPPPRPNVGAPQSRVSSPESPVRMPAEWERHTATWIAWPHHEPDWPGKLAPIPWVYAEIVRALSEFERVEILCHNEDVAENARLLLAAHGVPERPDCYRLHIASNDRVWLRDSAPTGVVRADGQTELVNWAFNGWAKYDNYSKDAEIGRVIERITGFPRI